MIYYQVLVEGEYLLGVAEDAIDAANIAREAILLRPGLEMTVRRCDEDHIGDLRAAFKASAAEYPKTLDGRPIGPSKLIPPPWETH